MNLRKLLSLAMALVLALGTVALAEAGDVEKQLEAANARVAELEAQLEKYRPIYESQIVAEYGEDGVVLLADAQAQFNAISQMYAQYGIPVDSYANDIKNSVLTGMVQQEVLDAKTRELGLDQLDEETMADLTAKADEDMENYISYYGSYFAKEGATDEENREATIKGLNDAGYTQESLLENRKKELISEKLVEYITKDVTVSEEEVQAQYKTMVDQAKENYTDDDYNYNSARSGGETVAWNPEGYRAVKHVLIKFNEEQAQKYSDLEDTLESLKEELEAVIPKDDANNLAATEAPEETPEPEATEEPEESPEPARPREEIEADIGKVGASIEALYAELLPKAQEVIDAFNNGTDFDTLIDKYGEDPGMTQEPARTEGYAVAENSSYWEQAFTDGAMAIKEIGGISEPVRGSNGIHIIYYLKDITPGEVPFEEIKDAVEATTLEAKKSSTYDEQVAAWVAEVNPVYHLDRFITY